MLFNLDIAIYLIPAILIALTVHEFSHGLAAVALGDDTPKRYGRLTLNPLAHLDPLGTLALLIVGFGWAKPVPVRFDNFRDFRRGMFYTALAGPMSNFLLAIVGAIIYTSILGQPANSWNVHVFRFSYWFMYINIILMVFNMIPIPPLDGSKIMYSFLPVEKIVWFEQRSRNFQLMLMMLIIFGVFGLVISPIAQGIMNGLVRIMNLF